MQSHIEVAKKLSAYSLMAGVFISLHKKTEAQVIYTDIYPDDTLFVCDSLALDLNNDGIADFKMEVNQMTAYWHGCFVIKGNDVNDIEGMATCPSYGSSSSYCSLTSQFFKQPFKLYFNDTINSTKKWVKPQDFFPPNMCNASPENWQQQALLNAFFYSSGAASGYWNNNLDVGYLGLKFKIDSDYHYGWLRLIVDTSAWWMILKDYAYNPIPDSMILAGEGIPSGESSIEFQGEIKILPNPSSDKIFISGLNEAINDLEFSIYDPSGRKVFLTPTFTNNQIQLNTSDLSNGIYLLEIVNNKTGTRETGKFVKQE